MSQKKTNSASIPFLDLFDREAPKPRPLLVQCSVRQSDGEPVTVELRCLYGHYVTSQVLFTHLFKHTPRSFGRGFPDTPTDLCRTSLRIISSFVVIKWTNGFKKCQIPSLEFPFNLFSFLRVFRCTWCQYPQHISLDRWFYAQKDWQPESLFETLRFPLSHMLVTLAYDINLE